jgi:hypothetical protein
MFGEVTRLTTTPSSGLTPTPTTEAEIRGTTGQIDPEPKYGKIYADFIEDELADQRSSKRSLEQRGLAVVSASGVLVALLFGFTTIARRTTAIHLSSSARIWFYLALGAFAFATGLGLLVNLPSRLEAAKTAALEAVLKNKWRDSESTARRRIAVTRLKLYATYRRCTRLIVAPIGGKDVFLH